MYVDARPPPRAGGAIGQGNMARAAPARLVTCSLSLSLSLSMYIYIYIYIYIYAYICIYICTYTCVSRQRKSQRAREREREKERQIGRDTQSSSERKRAGPQSGPDGFARGLDSSACTVPILTSHPQRERERETKRGREFATWKIFLNVPLTGLHGTRLSRIWTFSFNFYRRMVTSPQISSTYPVAF